MSFYNEHMPWHAGEEVMHKLLHVSNENPTSPFLTPYGANILIRSPLVAIGALDSNLWPWTSVWGGEAGFSQPVAKSVIGLRTLVDRLNDPVLEALLGDSEDGEVTHEKDGGKMVGGLAIDLETRSRVKLFGRSVAGAVSATEEGAGEVQLVVRIEQSIGNCPKYLNQKHIIPHIPQPKLESTEFPLPQAAVDLLEKADLFFISSSNHESDMDTNHRGGPPGFVRLLSNDDEGFTLVYPEYSGNRLYQTLGNLQTTPRAGLVFPDFDTGAVLYVTGETEILAGKDASNLISHTNLAVKIRVKAFKFVKDGLGFRGITKEFSPYNPPVRFLSSEEAVKVNNNEQRGSAKLIEKKIVTPTINRYKFQVADPKQRIHWKPGQYVALDFSDELDIGYSHMRDSDPKSLNDDWLRTFTISSAESDLDDGKFEITIRKVGPVTSFLEKINLRTGLEVGLVGVGGEFFLQQSEGESISFIAAGVGITPLLAQAPSLDLKRFRLYWTLRAEDLPLVFDTFNKFPGLAESTTLFLTGSLDENEVGWKKLNVSGAKVKMARITKDDLEEDVASKFYLCTGTPLRKTLLEWLAAKSVSYEGFDY